MVSITIEGSTVKVTVLGWHKILALRSAICFSRENIRSVDYATGEVYRPCWRMPGTSVPGLITAGTYVEAGKREFWDITRGQDAVVIDLENEEYTRLVVEASNPEVLGLDPLPEDSRR
jgi:hypothetical protein